MLDTSAGPITIEFLPDKAPDTVRQFLRLAEAGVYNGMAFHRVAPGFVIQTGALSLETAPLTEKQQKLVHNLQPEFNDTKHVKGIVSMARGDAPDSATTSFFICTGASTALDGVYTAFGRVVDGMAAVEAIEAAPRTGETPNERIDLRDAFGSSRSADERNFHRHADQILDLESVARLDVAGDGLGADARVVNLTVRIVEIREEHVPRHLSVDAHRLDAFQYAVPCSFQHRRPWILSLVSIVACVVSVFVLERQPIGSVFDEVAVPTEIVHADAEQTNGPASGVGFVEQLYCSRDERVCIPAWAALNGCA